MRRQSLATCSLMVFATTNRHDPKAAQYYGQQAVQLATASADTSRLVGAALRGMAEIWRPGYRYKKAGVLFPELVEADRIQGDLFSRPDDAGSQPRMAALDQLNRRFGRDTVRLATVGFEKGWKLRSEHLSPGYTTRFAELLWV